MNVSAQAHRLPAISAVDAFARLVTRPGVSWLDSSLPREADGRFSLLACEPQWLFRVTAGAWDVTWRDGRREAGAHGALARLDALLETGRAALPANAEHLPFAGGAIGWLSYDLGRQFERLPGLAEDDVAAADIVFGWYDAAVVWDHLKEETWIVGGPGDRGNAAVERLRSCLGEERVELSSSAPLESDVARSDLSREDYMQRVDAVREAIARGEYYQLNLVQRFQCSRREPPAQTYLRLRQSNPAPFAAYLALNDTVVLSSSPERFIEVLASGQIRSCPIKGTRPRGTTEADDARLRADLLASPKERAELLMIVDLLRNDLGRVCVPGSVAVKRLYALETFATVHHLVGEVSGCLRPEVTRAELLRAVFPGGSITGAPKVSAMRAIEALEPHRRGIGMGAIGYFSAHGRIDLNIAIRTIYGKGDTLYAPVGAGIVWDSVPAAEYDETLAKARALFTALGVEAVAR